MSDEPLTENLGFWPQHRFLILVGSSVILSLILVVVSMQLYTSSGAAQLDLSRPGYRSVSSQALKSDNTFQQYDDTGAINQASIDQFKALYAKQVQNVKAIDAFGGDPMNPDALEISAASDTSQP